MSEKISTKYFDKNNNEIFIGDSLYSKYWRANFTVGFTDTSSFRQFWVKSSNGKLDLGIGAAKEMEKINLI